MTDDIRASILDSLYNVYPFIEEDIWSKIRSEVCSYLLVYSDVHDLTHNISVICREVGITEESICENINTVVNKYVYNSVNK